MEGFGDGPGRGSVMYVVMRAFQMRRSRMPRPAIARGAEVRRRPLSGPPVEPAPLLGRRLPERIHDKQVRPLCGGGDDLRVALVTAQ